MDRPQRPFHVLVLCLVASRVAHTPGWAVNENRSFCPRRMICRMVRCEQQREAAPTVQTRVRAGHFHLQTKRRSSGWRGVDWSARCVWCISSFRGSGRVGGLYRLCDSVQTAEPTHMRDETYAHDMHMHMHICSTRLFLLKNTSLPLSSFVRSETPSPCQLSRLQAPGPPLPGSTLHLHRLVSCEYDLAN